MRIKTLTTLLLFLFIQNLQAQHSTTSENSIHPSTIYENTTTNIISANINSHFDNSLIIGEWKFNSKNMDEKSQTYFSSLGFNEGFKLNFINNSEAYYFDSNNNRFNYRIENDVLSILEPNNEGVYNVTQTLRIITLDKSQLILQFIIENNTYNLSLIKK
jgi:hypothetical protein